MANANSSKVDRPRKPYPDFPLSWHPSGYWCKRIRGKLHYFGPRYCDWKTGHWRARRQAVEKGDLQVAATPLRPDPEHAGVVRSRRETRALPCRTQNIVPRLRKTQDENKEATNDTASLRFAVRPNISSRSRYRHVRYASSHLMKSLAGVG